MFINLGQFLSTRADLLGDEYQAELAKLQDAAPPVPTDVVQDILALELDGDPGTVFASFELEPLAAGPIGQAHAATLRDGTEVVVKVRRPGAVEEVAQDLEILHDCGPHASRRWEAAARYDLVGLVEEFARTLRAQLDYLHEARNAERFAANFARDQSALIPRVFSEVTTSRVITLERIIDFGMVGVVDQHQRQQLGRLLTGFVLDEPDRLADALIALGALTGSVIRDQLRADLAGLLAHHSGHSISEIALGPAIREVLEIVRRHRLRVPHDLALLVRAVIMDEGWRRSWTPTFGSAPRSNPGPADCSPRN